MLLATIRRRFTLAIMSILFLTLLFPLNILPDTALGKTAGIIDNTQKFPAWGTTIAYLNSIDVYSNGASINNAINSTYGLEYQCVELVQRFFAQNWGTPKTWPNVAFAFQMFDNPPSGVKAIGNGTSPGPVRGDAIVFAKTTGFPDGHVAIVTDVSNGYVYFVEQNWGVQGHWGQDRLGISSTNFIQNRGTLPVRGWLHDAKNTGLYLTGLLRLEIAVPGISNVGSDNNNPQHMYPVINVQLYNLSNQVVFKGIGTSAYNNTRGVFDSQISLGSLPSSLYKVEVWTSNTLHKFIPGPYFTNYNVFGLGVETYLQVGMQSTGITTGGKLIWGFPLISGDINQDNKLDILDYNILIDCMKNRSDCTPNLRTASDLNDDGKVDQVDYNIWLRDSQAAGN